MPTITLYGKQWPVTEPVFKDLKLIISYYNQLAQPDIRPKQQVDDIINIMRLLIKDQDLIPTGWRRIALLKRPRLTSDEIINFIKAVPELCGFTDVERAETTSADPWGELYAYLACNHGYTWDDIDNTLTLSRWRLINDQWLQNPPANLLKAAELGYTYQKPMNFLDYAKYQFGLH